jgi:hypothetical protein
MGAPGISQSAGRGIEAPAMPEQFACSGHKRRLCGGVLMLKRFSLAIELRNIVRRADIGHRHGVVYSTG